VAIAALNAEARGIQGEVQCMLAIHQAHQQHVAAGLPIDWNHFEAHAKRSLPACSTWMNSCSKWVQKNAGGPTGFLLHELCAFQKALPTKKGAVATTTKLLGGEYLAKAAALSFGPAEQYPFVLNACIKAQMCGTKVVDGFYRTLKPSNISMLSSDNLRALVKEAEQLMRDARKLIIEYKIAHMVAAGSLGRMDARCILFMTKKGKEVEGRDFESLAAVAQDPAMC